jgi:hypothetical protein
MMAVKAISLMVCLTCLCACVLPVPATPNARGRELDAETGKPLAGACVSVQNHPKATAVTGADGSFSIPAETHWQFIAPPAEPVGLPDSLITTASGYKPSVIRIHGDLDISLTAISSGRSR